MAHVTLASRRVPRAVYVRRRIVVGGSTLSVVALGFLAIGELRGGDTTETARQAAISVPMTPVAPAAAVDPTEVAVIDEIEAAGCLLDVDEVARGDDGPAVECAQRALRAAGFYGGDVTGVFDDATDAATQALQADAGLYVDGIIGKNTAAELGIWPGQEAFVVRTAPPAPGAVDLWGLPLSPVASAGDNAPPLPDDAGQGTGTRVVYERTSQRVWAVDDEERIVRSYLVSGSRYRNEIPGVYAVYSRTESALGWDLGADLPYMVRYLQTERGHIGFHAIPSWRDSGEALQTVDELGTRLSGGCQRQAIEDARFMWEFAPVGTTVIVL